MRHNNLHQRQGGFTLLELLLYSSIASAVLLAATLFLATLLSSRVKNQTVNEVEQQAIVVMEQMTQIVRNADAINSPTAGNTAASLSLDVATAANDPTVFDLNSGAVRIAEGAVAPIALTNSRVVVSGLSFQNLSRSGSPGTVRISFTLTHTNPSNRQEYNYSKSFEGSASLRQP